MSRAWMPFYIADFQMDTLELQADEVGVYVVLLCLAWRRDGALPGDLDVLKTMLKRCFSEFHGLTFNRVVPKLLNRYFYQDSAGDWRQSRVEKELRKARECSENASRISQKRWKKNDDNELFQGVANAHRNARAMQSQSQSHIKDSFNGELRQESRWVPTKRIGSRVFKVGERAPAYDGQPPNYWKVLTPEDCR
jgi:uncharacterized protein YdaU (DUF1376 family)